MSTKKQHKPRGRTRTKNKMKAIDLLHARGTSLPAEWQQIKPMRGNDFVEIKALWIDELREAHTYQMKDLYPMARLGLDPLPSDTVVALGREDNDIQEGDEINACILQRGLDLYLVDLDGTDVVQYAVRLT